MDVNKVDLFFLVKGHYFASQYLPEIKERLLEADEETWNDIQMTQFKDPNAMQLISFLGGQLGIDRFMLGDTGVGIAKLLTCGGAGIWTIVDWFMIQDATREKNMFVLHQILR